jgi:hypothetical protein
MEDSKLPSGPGDTRINIISNPNSYQQTSHNSLISRITHYDIKEKDQDSSKKNEELKEEPKYPALKKRNR